MDILTQAVAETAPLHVKDASGVPLYDDGKPVRIHLYGPGSAQFSQVEAQQTQRALKRREDNDGKPTPATPDEARAEVAEDLAILTARFDHISYGDLTGAELFRAVYADRKLGFITRQAAIFSASWGNFKAGSVTG